MAKQKGIIPLKGTIGNITFYKSADGYLNETQEKISRIKPRTLDKSAEFQVLIHVIWGIDGIIW